jgi:hypothetical protein
MSIRCVCGHEFLGEVVALGASFGENADSAGRPARDYREAQDRGQGPLAIHGLLRRMLVRPPTLNFFVLLYSSYSNCRAGFTCRCAHSALFGTPMLLKLGGQAQYIHVPRAGGTLYALDGAALAGIAESSLFLLGDILPTGAFAALQALQHPKVQVALGCAPYAAAFDVTEAGSKGAPMTDLDRLPVFAVVGLGPVGLVGALASQSFVSRLADTRRLSQCPAISWPRPLAERRVKAHVVAVDLLPTRRAKMEVMHAAIDARARGEGEFVVTGDPDASHEAVRRLSGARACTVMPCSRCASARTRKPWRRLIALRARGAVRRNLVRRRAPDPTSAFHRARDVRHERDPRIRAVSCPRALPARARGTARTPGRVWQRGR